MYGIDQAVGAGLGLLLEGHNDRRQLKQQALLQELQLKGQRQMVDYNAAKQMELWNATNYGAQMEQLKKAGLNSALLYGKGGGAGGSTALAGAGGGPSGGQAPAGGMELMNMMMQKAQIKNIEADTKLKDSQASKTDTEGNIAKIEEEFRQYSLANAKSMTDMEVSKLRTEVQLLWNQRDISDATKDTEIDLRKQELTQKYAEIELKRSERNLTDKTIEKIAKEITQMADYLQLEKDKVDIQRKLQEFQTDWGDDAGSILKQIIGHLFKLF